jgi:hypothetical protein
MRKSTLVLILLAFAIALPVLSARAQESANSLSIKNNSNFTILELYVSRSGRDYWGPNYLGNNPLRPSQTFRLPNLTPGRYDLKLIDHDGYACLKQMQIAGDVFLELTNESLLSCEGRR